MKTISLLHPFSAKAIGVSEEDLIQSHSKPQVIALQRIVKENNELKFTVDYFTGSFWMKNRKEKGVVKQFFPITFPFFKRHQWRKQFSKIHYWWNCYKTPDITIINISGHGSKYTFKLAKLILQKNKKYIAMIGGLHMSYEGKALEYYQKAHHIIVHTENQRKELKKHENFSKLDIRVLPLGIDTDVFKPLSSKTRERCNLLYVGRLSRLKQVEVVLETIDFLKQKGINNIHLNIVGPISDEIYYNELLLLAEKLNIQKNVSFIGSVPHEDLIGFYQKSQLLLFPSQHESFGMVMAEAMACGTPVVALTGSGGPDEVIANNEDGILTTVKLYSKAVFELIQNNHLLNEMSNKARKKVIDKYSIEETTRVLFESIQSALHS